MIIDFNKKLDIMIPNAKCELNYNKDYELLLATVLSAQCDGVSRRKARDRGTYAGFARSAEIRRSVFRLHFAVYRVVVGFSVSFLQGYQTEYYDGSLDRFFCSHDIRGISDTHGTFDQNDVDRRKVPWVGGMDGSSDDWRSYSFGFWNMDCLFSHRPSQNPYFPPVKNPFSL